MAARKKRARTKVAREEVVETTRIKVPVTTRVRVPATLAEAVGDPVVKISDKDRETKVVRKVVRRKRAA
jgi:hypothetical protein